ncbi:MAG TPA: hypothetical protein VJI33_04025 [Candidatus Paceibacterota bacterium]
MKTIEIEQPGASVQQPELTGDSQFLTFSARVIANLRVPHWPGRVQQFFIQRPDLIPGALERGFKTAAVDNPEVARGYLERVIWGCREENFESKKLLVWILQQSRGLIEEVVLHSPYDPDEAGFGSLIAVSASRLIGFLGNHFSVVPMWSIMRGLGSPLCFGSDSSEVGGIEGRVWHLYLTFNQNDGRKARRLYWRDAMEGIKEIKIPNREDLVYP